MWTERHVALVLAVIVMLALVLSGAKIPEALASVQKSFILNPDSPGFSFEESSWNDSSSSNEHDFPSPQGGNVTYWVRIPKNSTVLNATMTLTGKIIYVYPVQVSVNGIKGLSIGNAIGSENQISLGTKEEIPSKGKVKLLHGSNGTYIWNVTFGNNQESYSTFIGNVTNDQGNEIAMGSQDSNVYLLYSNGTKIWEKSTGGPVKSVKIGDIFGTGENFVAAGSDKVYAINSSGGENWSTSISGSGCTGINDIAIGNFSSDAGNEIIVGCLAGKIFILNATGSVISNMTVGPSSINTVDVGNVTSDPGSEIAAGSSDSKIYIINSSGSAVWNYSTGDSVNSVKIGDVTTQYDGNETVAGSNDMRVYTLDSSGNLIWSFEADDFINTIAIGNLTSDSGNEVAAGAENGYLYVFNFDYFPDNASIDVNGSGHDWSYSGKLRTTVQAGGIPAFINAVQTYLNSCTADSAGMCDVSLLFHSDWPGKLNISGLNLTYNYNISSLVSAPAVSGWSRTSNISVNESVGNQARNISFASNPSNDILVQYIRINQTATACDFNGSAYSTATADGQTVCDVPDFTIPSSGARPGPFLLWDSNMSTGTPVLMNESPAYYTYATDNFLWRKNLTVWNNTGTLIRNITANATLNDTAAKGFEFLNVTWNNSECDLTPSAICPAYTQKNCSGDVFYSCRQDTNSNGVYDFFGWVQPYSNSSAAYVAGGSTNLAANLSNQSVHNSSGIWGSWFNYSVYVNDTEGDTVNVALWMNRSLSGWQRVSDQNVTGSGEIWFNLTSDSSWVGQSFYLFQYQDFNSSGYPVHSSQNTSAFTGSLILKHNVSVEHIQGSNGEVNRSSSVLLSVRINDTETGNWIGINGTKCAFWITTDGSSFGPAPQNTSNASGYCEYLFTPNSSYSAGNQTWKAGVWNDTYYSDSNSTNFILTVKGRINITLVSPGYNQAFFRSSTNTLSGRMVDEYGQTVQVSGYNCTFWFLNGSANELGNATTNSSGWCSLSWNPNCSVSLGQFTVNATLSGNASGFYAIEDPEDNVQILMRDLLLTEISSPAPYSQHHRGDYLNLNSTANDTCLLCSQPDYQTAWSLKSKQSLQVLLNETRGFPRANETIIINGTELEGLGIDLSDWRISYTKVLSNGQEVPSEVKAWTDSGKTQTNSTQVFLSNYSELVFLASLPALGNSTYIVYYNESNPSDWNISFIRNSGFEAGLASWQCANGSQCIGGGNLCDCSASTGNGEASGNYSLRLLVNKISLTNVTSSAYQSLGMQMNSSYIKVRYRTAGLIPGVQLSAGSGSCSLNASSAWTEAVCNNASFQSAASLSIMLSDGEVGQNCSLYIDYACIADSSGNCTSMDSGYSPVKAFYSQEALGSGNMTWQVPLNETLGRRVLLANSSGPNHAQNFSAVPLFLFGWSNLSWMNLSSGYCIHNQTLGTFECMSNATIDFYCLATDTQTGNGIHNYNASFFRNGTLLGHNMTNSSGYALFRWLNSTGQIGTYNISCNISDTVYEPFTYFNITSNNSRNLLLDIISGNTTASVSVLPQAEAAANITRESNHTFFLSIAINNTGNGSMYSPVVNISAPLGVYVQPMTCPTLVANSSCSATLQTNVTQSAEAANLLINITVLWSNADSTQGNSTNSTAVSVENNTALNITQTQLNMTISRGDSRQAGTFTAESFGNTPLSNVTFSLSGGNSSAIYGWTAFTPQNISSVAKAGAQSVLINLTIPSNTTEGVYTATLAANSTGSSCSPATECLDTLSLLINVTPPDWETSPANLSKTIGMTSENGTIGTVTVTNNKNQNYSFSVAVSGSSYIRTDRSSFNLTALSTAYVYVYHNSSGSYIPAYWSANVTLANLNSSAFPQRMNISVNFSVIETSINIISPNQTNPTSPVNASDRISITVNATRSGLPASSSMVWSVLAGGQGCGSLQSSYNSTTQFWDMNCTAPSIAGNLIYNNLYVTGNDTQMGGSVSDEESNAVIYQDITPPQPSGVAALPVNYYSSAPYILINATITDNTGVNSSWLAITQPNGTSTTVLSPSNASSLYTFNFSSPNLPGDYDVYVYANDTYGQVNSTAGWFDIYRPFTVSGSLTDPSSANQSINFTFYRPGTSTVIHTFSTNASQASFNWSVHDRNYEILISAFSHSLRLYGVNTTASALNQHNSSAANLSGAFRFDSFPNRTSQDISNFDLPNTAQKILLGLVIETPNLSYSNATITIDYAAALAAAVQQITVEESNLRIFRCMNWNFQSRVCSSGEFSHFNESLFPNTSANTFTFTATPSTAYAVAESCYPNICGQSQQQQPSGGGTAAPSNGGGVTQAVCGNGKCETGENSQNCPKDCPPEEFPFTVKTGITNIRLRPGDKATYPFSITNMLNKVITADISVSGLESYLTLEKSSVQIAANRTETPNIYVTVPETAEAGTYTGTITVSAEGKAKEVPVTMVIGLEGRSQLNLILSIFTKSMEPEEDLKYSIEIRNVGFGENLSIEMIYTLRRANTDEIIKQINETLNLSLRTQESVVFNKIIPLRDSGADIGQYYLEAVATFDHRFVRDIETFEVTVGFFQTTLGQFVSWFVIIGAMVFTAYYERKKYSRWKMKKSRYLFPVNYSKVPVETEEAFWIGKVAETDKKAWFNPNDLTTHILIAGSTGAGKSVSASVFVEEALEKKIPVIVFDPTAQWTGFVKQCEDPNLLRFYKQFGMDERYAKPYKGMIFEITDPHIAMDFRKYMIPGEITVFTMNRLGPGEYDVAVKNIISAIFRTGWEESTKLRMIMVFDEVHRLLEKYGGIGGYTSLEQACREFRKWGIGIIMCSQVLADFKEAIAGNVLTDIQMNTKSLVDIRKVETKYGQEYASRISRQGVGVGMMQNPKYNEGKPYFVQFRPTWHNPHKITDEELKLYKEFAQRLEVIEQKIEGMRKRREDTSDIEIELKLAKDKLKQGRFRMAKIYINSLEERLK